MATRPSASFHSCAVDNKIEKQAKYGRRARRAYADQPALQTATFPRPLLSVSFFGDLQQRYRREDATKRGNPSRLGDLSRCCAIVAESTRKAFVNLLAKWRFVRETRSGKVRVPRESLEAPHDGKCCVAMSGKQAKGMAHLSLPRDLQTSRRSCSSGGPIGR